VEADGLDADGFLARLESLDGFVPIRVAFV
jgi:hypothetical protein